MQQYQHQVRSYLSQHRPEMWSQLEAQEVTALARQLADRVQQLVEIDTTPMPTTNDHAMLLAHHQQVRSRAEQIATQEVLYDQFPPPEETDQVDLQTAESHDLLGEIARLRSELD